LGSGGSGGFDLEFFILLKLSLLGSLEAAARIVVCWGLPRVPIALGVRFSTICVNLRRSVVQNFDRHN
jgi:hypothetical protein